MGKLSIVEKMIYAAQHDEPMPLKGHARLILEDVRDGHQDIVESDNVVTNAIASVLQRNFCLLSDFSKMLPLKKLFGGVLCFESDLTETAGAYTMPNDLVAYLSAHAGSEANNTGSLLRGSPVRNDYVETQTSIKQVWLWDNTQGNNTEDGAIHTICLCPDSLGNMGTKPYNSSLNCWSGLAIANDIGDGDVSTLTRTAALRRPISIDSDGKTGKAIWWSDTTFEEIGVRHDWNMFGIMRDTTTWQEIAGSSRSTDQIRSFTLGKANICEDSDYYYLYEVESAVKLKIDKVSKQNFAVTQADITYPSNISMNTGSVNSNAGAMWFMCVPRWAFDGRYLYLPNSSANGFVAVNPNNNGDWFIVDGTVSVNMGCSLMDNRRTNMRPVVIAERLVYGENYIINGSNAYPIAFATNVYKQNATARVSYLNTIKQGAAVYGVPFRSENNSDDRGQGAALLKFWLSTVNVLPEPKKKTTSQTMRIEYTLTEVT